jgi:hypothetical protein
VCGFIKKLEPGLFTLCVLLNELNSKIKCVFNTPAQISSRNLLRISNANYYFLLVGHSSNLRWRTLLIMYPKAHNFGLGVLLGVFHIPWRECRVIFEVCLLSTTQRRCVQQRFRPLLNYFTLSP